jgi:hypothetical protein
LEELNLLDRQTTNRCKKCILPDSFPSIFFIDGVCSFCIDFENKKHDPKLRGKKDLEMQLVSDSDSKYDCLVPLSGGKDSSFIMFYLVKVLQLNPLALLVDTGYQTDVSIENIKKICSILKTDLIIAFPTNYRKQAIYEALKVSFYLKRFWKDGICGHCENILRSTAVKEAKTRSIHKIVWGSTDFEDSTNSYHKGWNSTAFKFRYGSQKSIKEILIKLLNAGRDFAVAPGSVFHVLKFWVYNVLMNFDLGINGFFDKFNPTSEFSFNRKSIKVVYFFDFIKYDPIHQIEIIKKNLDWQCPANREMRSDCILSCFENYNFMKQTGISKNGFLLSTLIRYGLINRKEALEKEMIFEKNLKSICYETYVRLQKDYDWVFE